ncbi:MAG TPA: ABC transporter ATP-binding protein [Acidimicrobiales bacterium]|nr:ABC transporter ATP-binding protein [Acidimicrobiales bacterium]
MTLLEVRSLVVDYGGAPALRGLDITVEAGTQVALVGPNGAGKSTLLRVAAGLLDALEGGVTVDGCPAGSLEARALTSYLPDTPALYDDLSLAEHLEYVARLHGVQEWEERAADLLDRLGLSPRRDDPPGGFSRGMRQKASIALAFVRPFRLLLADEPFDGLDSRSRDALSNLVGETVAGGAAVVLATHHLEVVEQASRGLALEDGLLVFDGPVTAPEVARLVSP